MDSEPERLTKAVADAIVDSENTVVIPVVALWEIQIKSGLGKLTISRPLPEIVEEQQDNGMVILPVTPPHVFRLAGLPNVHRDPFDRLLVAQALAENLTIASSDRVLRDYGVPVLW